MGEREGDELSLALLFSLINCYFNQWENSTIEMWIEESVWENGIIEMWKEETSLTCKVFPY